MLHYSSSLFHPIDQQLGSFVANQSTDDKALLGLSAALCSLALQDGHICIDIDTSTPQDFWPAEELFGFEVALPESEEWLSILSKSELVSVNESSVDAPLTLAGSRLYLTKYYRYESYIAEQFDLSSQSILTPAFTTETKNLLASLFQERDNLSSFGGDLQLAGVLLPFYFKYSIISGGPGTGKTTTVAKMLALALSDNSELTIALAAPTGKAAQRMYESLQGNLDYLSLPDKIDGKLATLEASTLHRLLGSKHHEPTFKHNDKNPLPYDLLIIDEASMIDVPMMAKLLQAVKPEARCIFLGDQYQLASVEAGSALGDLCKRYGANSFSESFLEQYNQFASQENQLAHYSSLSPVLQLERSYRFSPDSAVDRISRMINAGNVEATAQMVSGSDIELVDSQSQKELARNYTKLLSIASPIEALVFLPCQIILTATNEGSYGQKTINRAILDELIGTSKNMLSGMPIMITSNAYSFNLFNGDMGVLFEKEGQWFGCFEDAEDILEIPLVLLPSWEAAFAITIHKSQGSEYNHVTILLGDQEIPLLTRELLYTAITRVKPLGGSAKGAVKIVGAAEVLQSAISKQIIRSSGLGQT